MLREDVVNNIGRSIALRQSYAREPERIANWSGSATGAQIILLYECAALNRYRQDGLR
jgi:hypothetical protein